MFEVSPVFLGITSVLLGVGFFALAFFLLRAVPRVQPVEYPIAYPPVPPGIMAINDAVLLVQSGGRVMFINQVAREWFGVLDEELNLERLTRRVRPSETFLGLCASEGQARFSLNGIFIEGTSYFIPYEGTHAILVTLHRPQVTAISPSSVQSGVHEQTLDIFAEISQSMASSLDLEKTLQSILESIEKIIPSDFPIITIWEEESKKLVPYRFVGIPGTNRRLERSNERYSASEGYSGLLVTKKAPLLVANVNSYQDVRPQLDRKQIPIQSYLGMPLILAGDVIGTIELASQVPDCFSAGDLEALRILSGQAAAALHNALLYEEEQRRVLELSGLAQLAHAATAMYDSKDLYARLVESIHPLIEVGVIGFWMHDEKQHALEAKAPFVGIPIQFLEHYSIPIQPDSRADEIWAEQQVIVAENIEEDERLQALGFLPTAQAAGYRSTVLVPLASGGKSLGYLQAASKKDNSPFDQDDLRILGIVASQAAIIIENAALAQQTQRRAQRAEALRRIASLTGSAATLDEILQFSVRDLARLLQADVAMIMLLDENRAELRLHKESLFGISKIDLSRLGRASTEATQVRIQRSYLTGNAREDSAALQSYRQIINELGIESMLMVPLLVRDRNIGEMMLGSRSLNFFERSDLILIDTAAGQLAGAIEQSVLYKQTDETLRRRVDQLTALTRISRELNTSLDLQHLLQRVYDEVLHTTRSSCGTILLFDPLDENGQSPRVILQIGDQHNQGLSVLEHKVLEQEEPLIVKDFEPAPGEAWQYNDQGEQGDPPAPPHEGIRSALIVPIAYQEHVAGLIHLHSTAPNKFDETSLDIAQSLAIQAAIALGNAQRYHEQVQRSVLLARRVETLSQIFQSTNALQEDRPLEESLEAIAYAIQESTPFDVVLMSVYDHEQMCLRRVTGAGLTLEQLREAIQHKIPWSAVEQLAGEQYKIGRAYLIPAEKSPVVPPDFHIITTTPEGTSHPSGLAWNQDDILMLPLFDANGWALGMINVNYPRDGLRPDRPTIETLEIFASQAALAIENDHRVQAFQKETRIIKRELERARQSAIDAQAGVPVLLQKDLEQTLSIQRLSQRAKRIRVGLEIGENLYRQGDRSSLLLAFGKELLSQMDFDAVLIAEPSTGGPRLMHYLSSTPAAVNPETLLGQRNPVRQSLQTGQNILVSNIYDNTEWRVSPLLQALDARSFICLYIPVEDAQPGLAGEAAFLAVRKTPYEAFSTDDEHLYTLMARQVAIALQNLRLLTETNRRLKEVNMLLEFSRQIGSLDPASIIHTLADSAVKLVSAADTCMVALWDPKQNLLVPQAALGFQKYESILEIAYRSGEALPGQVFRDGQPVMIAEVNFAVHYQLPSENLMRYRNATQGKLPISELIVPIGGTGDPSTQLPVSTRTASRPTGVLGVLVLDNFKSAGVFTAEDQALVASLAHQTALTLENARLYQASEQRAEQLRVLTDVAAMITSSLQSDELIASLLDQARAVISYDTGTLWLRQDQKMNIRAASGFDDSEERVGISVEIEDSLLIKEMIATGKPLTVPDVREDSRFPSLIEPTYLSWLGIPLVSKGEVVGVIALEKVDAGYYTDEHIQAATTFAGQSAVALENARLYEESVFRAAELDRRSKRLATLNRLSAELSGSLDPSYILKVTVRELSEAIHSSSVSALLFEKDGSAWMQAEVPQTEISVPFQIPAAPVFERLNESLGIYQVEDVFDGIQNEINPLLEPLEPYLRSHNTRALLTLPVASSSSLLGLLFIQCQEAYHFTADEVELARTISNQASVAVQNARLFAETQHLFNETHQRSAELATLYDLGVNVAQVLERDQLIDLTFENLKELLNVESIGLVIQEENGDLICHILEKGEVIEPIVLPVEGSSFSQYVLMNKQALIIGDIEREKEELPSTGFVVGEPSRSWMGVPLVVRGSAIGVLSVQSDEPDRFDKNQLRLIEQVGNQLAAALDNARLFSTVQNYAASLEQRVADRTAELEKEHQRTHTLLGISTELSTSLEMDVVLTRTLSLINDSTGADHSLIVLVNPDDNHLFHRAAVGYRTPLPKGGRPTALKHNEGLGGWVITKRQPLLIPDLKEDERWIHFDDEAAQHRSAMVVPLMMGEESLGALLLFHTEPGKFFTDQLDLVQATAKQIAVAINNASLFNLIRDQAERLGDMLRRQHVETSRSQAILEAVADGVLVTDSNREITLFNASAEQILGMKRQQILGHTLEHFTGLFGKAAQKWMETIHAWSANPELTSSGDGTPVYTEQVVLDDRRVVSVHLAPVRLRKDFLGTVSIFQDITHQVEVDRLKSEFVATVSHELRTPMTSIKGYVEILLMGVAGQLTEQQHHFLEIVKSNTERLAILVNDLLDVSRIEAGKVELALQQVDMRELISQAVADLSRRCKSENKPMDIQVSLPREAHHAYGDPDRIRQVLDNLLENAYYYTDENGKILVSLSRIGDEIQVAVKDNGIGIPEEDQKRIFERFYRGEDPLVLATSGTGLGLSIVSRLIEMHRGRLWVESRGVRGDGSIFSFSLPVNES
ncbi:MAG: GAF domain-containing protein [Chloroflexi bacterium]|nr:MAG: GAF domain-containing protein [Chloroflexota bacterium]